MPDIGLGEVLMIAVLALLIFGPDRLPKVAADAGRLLRQVRDLASAARKDLVDAAGLQEDGELRSVVNQLDPRQVLREEPTATPQTPAQGDPRESARRQSPASAAASSDPPRAAAEAGVEDWT